MLSFISIFFNYGEILHRNNKCCKKGGFSHLLKCSVIKVRISKYLQVCYLCQYCRCLNILNYTKNLQ